MADNFLERHHEIYELRKVAWLKKRKHLKFRPVTKIQRPEDESL
ncbi:dehydrogenase [Prevotella histicola]|nr:dehydrogenase [Prevotella histicola]